MKYNTIYYPSTISKKTPTKKQQQQKETGPKKLFELPILRRCRPTGRSVNRKWPRSSSPIGGATVVTPGSTPTPNYRSSTPNARPECSPPELWTETVQVSKHIHSLTRYAMANLLVILLLRRCLETAQTLLSSAIIR